VDVALGLTGALVGGTIMRRAGVTFSGSGPAEVVVGASGAMAVIGVARIFGHLVERAGFPASSARMRTVVHDLEAQIGRLGDVERLVLTKILRREPVSRDTAATFDEQRTFGEILADRIAAFGGRWTFLLLFVCGVMVWMRRNTEAPAPVESYPLILL